MLRRQGAEGVFVGAFVAQGQHKIGVVVAESAGGGSAFVNVKNVDLQ
jgi:hypothetical protein